MSDRRRQQGVSLLEVLVAFAILGLCLGVLLQVFSGGLRNTALAEDYTQAALYAESILAAVGGEAPLAPGEDLGRVNDKFAWRIRIEPYVDELLPQDSPAVLYWVTVEVFWQGVVSNRSVVLETLRLAPLPEGALG